MIIDHVQPSSHIPNTLDMLRKFDVTMELAEDFLRHIQYYTFIKDGVKEIVEISYEDLFQTWMFLQPDHWGVRYVGRFVFNIDELSGGANGG